MKTNNLKVLLTSISFFNVFLCSGIKCGEDVNREINLSRNATRIFDLLEQIDQRIDTIVGPKTIILGNTGSGKSTLQYYLNGFNLSAQSAGINDGDHKIVLANNNDSNEPHYSEIGHEITVPRTILPVVTEKYIDCHGYSDSRQFQDIVNTYSIYKLINNVNFINILLVVSKGEIEEVRGRPFMQILSQLGNTFKNNIEDFCRGLVLVVTKTKFYQRFNENNEDYQRRYRERIQEFFIRILNEQNHEGNRVLGDNGERVLQYLYDNPHRIAIFNMPQSEGTIGDRDKNQIIKILEGVEYQANITPTFSLSDQSKSSLKTLLSLNIMIMKSIILYLCKNYEQLFQIYIENNQPEKIKEYFVFLEDGIGETLTLKSYTEKITSILNKLSHNKLSHNISDGFERLSERMVDLERLIDPGSDIRMDILENILKDVGDQSNITPNFLLEQSRSSLKTLLFSKIDKMKIIIADLCQNYIRLFQIYIENNQPHEIKECFNTIHICLKSCIEENLTFNLYTEKITSVLDKLSHDRLSEFRSLSEKVVGIERFINPAYIGIDILEYLKKSPMVFKFFSKDSSFNENVMNFKLELDRKRGKLIEDIKFTNKEKLELHQEQRNETPPIFLTRNGEKDLDQRIGSINESMEEEKRRWFIAQNGIVAIELQYEKLLAIVDIDERRQNENVTSPNPTIKAKESADQPKKETWVIRSNTQPLGAKIGDNNEIDLYESLKPILELLNGRWIETPHPVDKGKAPDGNMNPFDNNINQELDLTEAEVQKLEQANLNEEEDKFDAIQFAIQDNARDLGILPPTDKLSQVSGAYAIRAEEKHPLPAGDSSHPKVRKASSSTKRDDLIQSYAECLYSLNEAKFQAFLATIPEIYRHKVLNRVDHMDKNRTSSCSSSSF